MQNSTSMPPLNPPTPPAADPMPPAADPAPPLSDTLAPAGNTDTAGPTDDSLTQVVERVNKGDNILIALSKNPSVDELTASIALTLYLDKYGKHATAIFSGKTPNAIKFLRPEETLFENTDSLQDFIVALNKEKADHLRYKLEGDFVKVYITPYKTKIDEKDLEFSYGEYNVDLVIALNVPTRDDLDAALSEHGRIMHDATAININAGPPQNFGDLEWGDPAASSVSEMTYRLISQLDKEEKLIDASIANALLAGLISATERFSNARTSSEAMSIASHLLESGADQQMVAAKIAASENSAQSEDTVTTGSEELLDEGASISINHGEEKVAQSEPMDVDLSTTLDNLMSAPTPEPEGVPDPMEFSQPAPELPSVEPHTPTSFPDFPVAPPVLPGSEAAEPELPSVETTAPTPEVTSMSGPTPIPAPESISAPEPVPAPAPEPDLPQIPQASSSIDALLPPPPPPPAAPNVAFSEPSIPTPTSEPTQFTTPTQESTQFTTPAVVPAEPAPNFASPTTQTPMMSSDSTPGISSFQIPDTGQDEGIFGS